MQKRRLGVVALLSILAVSGVQAAPAPSDAGTTPTAVLVDRNHHLGPGDVIEISVNSLAEFTRTVRLFRDGSFDFPLAGKVNGAGLTVEELATRLIDALKSEFRQPVVTVTLRDVYVAPKAATPKVTVLGAVANKAEIDLSEPKPLRVVLAQAGPTEKADLTTIRVRYPDGSARIADFSRFNLTGEAPGDLLLQGGEEVVVLDRPTAAKADPVHVTVLGAVTKPGRIEVDAETTILDILEKVGGAKPAADLERVTVKGPRHPEPRTLNVERFLNGDTSAGYTGQSDDVFVVPEKPLKVFVFGEVAKPGEFAIRPGERVLDVYLQSGIAPNADPGRAQIIRRGKDGKPQTKTVDLREVMKGRDRGNESLNAGDILFVPGKRGRRGILDYLGTLTTPLWFLTNAFKL